MARRKTLFQHAVRDRIVGIAAGFCIPGSILFFAGVRLAALEWWFHSSSDVAQGTVLRKWVSSSRNRPGAYRKAYYVGYEYRTVGGCCGTVGGIILLAKLDASRALLQRSRPGRRRGQARFSGVLTEPQAPSELSFSTVRQDILRWVILEE